MLRCLQVFHQYCAATKLEWEYDSGTEFDWQVHEIYLASREWRWWQNRAWLPVGYWPRFAPFDELLLLIGHHILANGQEGEQN